MASEYCVLNEIHVSDLSTSLYKLWLRNRIDFRPFSISTKSLSLILCCSVKNDPVSFLRSQSWSWIGVHLVPNDPEIGESRESSRNMEQGASGPLFHLPTVHSPNSWVHLIQWASFRVATLNSKLKPKSLRMTKLETHQDFFNIYM